jgi:hypothetical protein
MESKTDIIINKECAICYNDLINNLITLPCNHTFHNECVNNWTKVNKNCPYCRYNLEQNRLPPSYYDELIADDGNIDNLNEDNFHYFYHYNHPIYNKNNILEFIDKIKAAKELKSSLLIFEDYNINCNYRPNSSHEPSIGKLIKICRISSYGSFSCYFQTEKGIVVYNNIYYNFNRIIIN